MTYGHETLWTYTSWHGGVSHTKFRTRRPFLAELWPFVFFVRTITPTIFNYVTKLYMHIHLGMTECRALNSGHAVPYLQSYGPLFIFFVQTITPTIFDLRPQNFMDLYILAWRSVVY